MADNFSCPNCSMPYQMRPELVGYKLRCQTCGKSMIVDEDATARLLDDDQDALIKTGAWQILPAENEKPLGADDEVVTEDSAKLLHCPRCGKVYPLLDKMIGRKLRCSNCRDPFLVNEDGTATAVDTEQDHMIRTAAIKLADLEPKEPPTDEKKLLDCPHCGKIYPFLQKMVGRKLRCSSCRESFLVGEQATATKIDPTPAAGTAVEDTQAHEEAHDVIEEAKQGARANFDCPHCGKKFPLMAKMSGLKLRCNGCKNAFIVGQDGTANKLEDRQDQLLKTAAVRFDEEPEAAPSLPSAALAPRDDVAMPVARPAPATALGVPQRLICPHCERDFPFAAKYLGRRVLCKHCRSAFKVDKSGQVTAVGPKVSQEIRPEPPPVAAVSTRPAATPPPAVPLPTADLSPIPAPPSVPPPPEITPEANPIDEQPDTTTTLDEDTGRNLDAHSGSSSRGRISAVGRHAVRHRPSSGSSSLRSGLPSSDGKRRRRPAAPLPTARTPRRLWPVLIGLLLIGGGAGTWWVLDGQQRFAPASAIDAEPPPEPIAETPETIPLEAAEPPPSEPMESEAPALDTPPLVNHEPTRPSQVPSTPPATTAPRDEALIGQSIEAFLSNWDDRLHTAQAPLPTDLAWQAKATLPRLELLLAERQDHEPVDLRPHATAIASLFGRLQPQDDRLLWSLPAAESQAKVVGQALAEATLCLAAWLNQTLAPLTTPHKPPAPTIDTEPSSPTDLAADTEETDSEATVEDTTDEDREGATETAAAGETSSPSAQRGASRPDQPSDPSIAADETDPPSETVPTTDPAADASETDAASRLSQSSPLDQSTREPSPATAPQAPKPVPPMMLAQGDAGLHAALQSHGLDFDTAVILIELLRQYADRAPRQASGLLTIPDELMWSDFTGHTATGAAYHARILRALGTDWPREFRVLSISYPARDQSVLTGIPTDPASEEADETTDAPASDTVASDPSPETTSSPPPPPSATDTDDPQPPTRSNDTDVPTDEP